MADDKPKMYDQALANQAAAVDQCLKLGGVILKPKDHKGTGFSAPTEPEPPHGEH